MYREEESRSSVLGMLEFLDYTFSTNVLDIRFYIGYTWRRNDTNQCLENETFQGMLPANKRP